MCCRLLNLSSLGPTPVSAPLRPRICITNKLSGGAGTARPRTTLFILQLYCGIIHSSQNSPILKCIIQCLLVNVTQASSKSNFRTLSSPKDSVCPFIVFIPTSSPRYPFSIHFIWTCVINVIIKYMVF